MVVEMSMMQQYPPSRYYTLGGQSTASSRPGQHHGPSSTLQRRMTNTGKTATASGDDGSTPICRCRVLYLGSAVPQVTKDGLQGIQEPLRELYPEGGAMGAKGIDSWLSVWSNGLLLENVDENHQRVTRFFPIESLHYCAAVRYVLVPSSTPGGSPPPSSPGNGERIARFLPLDSPFARHPNIHHPPLFACIMRRTTGIKVLECHVFICKRETAANALVRCCFHAYADSTYAHHLEEEEEGANKTLRRISGTNGAGAPGASSPSTVAGDLALNSIEKVETWKLYQQQQNGRSKSVDDVLAATAAEKEGSTSSHGMGSASVSMLILDHGSADEDNASSILNGAGDQNHKIWLPSPALTSSAKKGSAARRLIPTGPVASVSRGGPVPVADMYGTSTLRSIRSSVSSVLHPAGNSRRPRQIPAPSAAPPPPPPVIFLPGIDESDGKIYSKSSKTSKSKKSSPGRSGGSDLDDGMSSVVTGPISGGSRRPSNSVFNFPIHHPGAGGPGRPPVMGPGYPPMSYPFFPGRGPPPGAYLVPMPLPMANGKKSKSKFGTFTSAGGGVAKVKPPKLSSKAAKQQQLLLQQMMQQGGGPPQPPPPPGMMFVPPPPPVMAPPMALGVPVPMMAPPLSMRRQSGSAEEPIYMPSHVRPLSPIASYAPAHFPHEAYLMQQHYAMGMAGMPGMHHHHPGMAVMTPASTLTKPGKKEKKLSKNKEAQLQQQQQQQQQTLALMDGMSLQAEEVSLSSQPGGGIYRKGHLNERAFSYSIRQEHRSRSYSSLAGLGQSPSLSAYPLGVGHPPGLIGTEDLRTHDKKERELIQMVHDLDLSGDDLERSQVPLAMYPAHHRQQHR